MAAKPASKKRTEKVGSEKTLTEKRAENSPKNKKKAKSAAKKSGVAPSKSTKGDTRQTANKKGDSKRKHSQKETKKAIKALILKGRDQGYLTYDDINAQLPDDMMSAEQLDDTLMIFDDNDIEIVREKKDVVPKAPKTVAKSKAAGGSAAATDFGAVTDPVKMYLREMGMVTLLSREGEVEIAKKIEAGEQEVLRALLDTSTGVACLMALGQYIEDGLIRSKYVLRDIDEGETFVDEILQTERFLSTIKAIQEIDEENRTYRERLFSEALASDEQRRIRRSINRRNNKIFDQLKEWRLESSVIDKIEVMIRSQIEWFDTMNKMIAMCSDAAGVSMTQLRSQFSQR